MSRLRIHRSRAAAVVAALAAVCVAPCAPALAGGIEAQDVATGTERPVVAAGSRLTHVVFLATWCPPCLEELQDLADAAARYEDDGYQVVLVAVSSRQDPDKLKRFAAGRDLPGRLMFDASGRAQRALGVDAVPTHVLLASDGSEVARASSLRDGVLARVAAYLEESR